MPYSYTPIVVEPDHPEYGTWTVRIGNNEVIKHSMPTKGQAMKLAKERASHSPVRPGVVIRNADGSFNRFWSNDKYWRTEYVKPRGDW